jgi:hypothetical protein
VPRRSTERSTEPYRPQRLRLPRLRRGEARLPHDQSSAYSVHAVFDALDALQQIVTSDPLVSTAERELSRHYVTFDKNIAGVIAGVFFAEINAFRGRETMISGRHGRPSMH